MGRDEVRRRDAERRDDDHPRGSEGHGEERAERDGVPFDTAHEDTVPFDKESRLDEPDSGG